MKRKIYLLATLLAMFVAGSVTAQQTFYLQTAGVTAAQTAGSWRTDATLAGGGTAAVAGDFSTSGNIFIISTGQTTAAMGNGTTLTFGAGVTLRINGTGKFTVGGGSNPGATLTVNGTVELNNNSVQINVPSATGGGTNTFTLGSGASIKTVNTTGLSGAAASGCAIEVAASRAAANLNTAANYEFAAATGTQAMTGVPTTVGDLTLSGGGTKTMSATLATISGTLTTSGTVTTTTTGALSVGVGIVIGSGTTFNAAGFALTVTNPSTISGTLNVTSATGAKAFNGLVTINSGGIIDNTSVNASVSFGGITNNTGGDFRPGSTSTITFATAGSLSGSGTWGTFGTITNTAAITNGVSLSATNYNASAALTNNGTITLSGTFTGTVASSNGTSGVITAPTFTMTGVNFTNNGTITSATTVSGTGGIVNAATGTLEIQGTISITTLTATAAGNIVKYTAAGAQTVKTGTYGGTLVLGGSGVKTTSSVTIPGGATISLEGTATAGNLPSYTGGGKLQYKGTGNITTGVEWPNTSSLLAGVTIDQGVGNTVTLSANKTMTTASAANVNIVSGTLDASTFTLTRTTGSGSLIVANGATFKTSAAGATPFTGFTNSFASGSNVEYSGTSAQTVLAATYSNLTISGSRGANSVTLANGTIQVGGTLTTSASFSGGAYVTTGNTMEFNGTSSQSIPALGSTAYNGLTVNNSAGASLGTNVTVGGALTLTSGDLSIGNNTLTLNGTASTSSTNSLIGGSTSNLTIGGNLGTNLFFDAAGTNNTLNNLNVTASGNATLGAALKLRGTMTPTAGGTFNSNSFLTVVSDATSTGRILSLTSFNYSGTTNVQRYIPGKTTRKWTYLASPIAGTIASQWQDDVFITGPGTGGSICGAQNSNGFDVTTSNSPSMYGYNETPVSGSRWVGVAGTSASLVPGLGYRINIRGNRGAADANCTAQLNTAGVTNSDNATITTSGNLTIGDVAVNAYGVNSQFTFIGNPYPSEIDWDNATLVGIRNTNGLNHSYWTYCKDNPTTGPTSAQYTTYNTGVASNGCGIITGVNGRYVASGQAFFVQNTSGSDKNISNFFQESFKTSNVQQGVFRTNTTWTDIIRVAFRQNNGTHIDEAVIRFLDEPGITTTTMNGYDAISFNSGDYIASLKGTTGYAIQTRPASFINDTVKLKLVSTSTGNYKLYFSEFENFTAASQIILLDAYTATQHDIKGNPNYSFDITADAVSQGNDRFKIVFRSASALPLSSLSLNASIKQNAVEVSWIVAAEQGINKYIVERSDNGREFYGIATVNAKGAGLSSVNYNHSDIQSLKGVTYYRIKSISTAGDVKYSVVVKVKPGKSEAIVSLYPNPVREQLNLIITNGDSYAKSTVYIRNAQGRTIMQQGLTTVNGNAFIDVSKLATGLYFITIVNSQGETLVEKFVKN